MNYKFSWWLFSLLIFVQLQLDLLCFKFGLQGILIFNLIFFIYSKKSNLFKFSLGLLAFSIEKFITCHKLLNLEISLLLFSFFICQISKRNLIFKSIIFYLLLIIYVTGNYYLACNYFFNTDFNL